MSAPLTANRRRHLRQLERGRPSFEEVAARIALIDGVLIWKARPDQSGWNRQFEGKPVSLRTDRKGYHHFKVHRYRFQAHRVVWALANGRWPDGQIDHINGIPSDNRIENLRDVEGVENARNKRRQANNSSGATGVHWASHCSKWLASISEGGTTKHLGVFTRFEDAVAARKAAEQRLGYSAEHGAARTEVAA